MMRSLWFLLPATMLVPLVHGQSIQKQIEFDANKAHKQVAKGFQVSERVGPPPPNYFMPTGGVLDIGSEQQFFLDDYVIENTFELNRKMNHPKRYEGNPILDSATFKTTQPYLSVIDDPNYKGGKYRLWYNRGNPIYHVESDDGLHWENPQVAWDMPRGYGVGVLDDRERSKDPARNFKSLNWQATRAKEDKPGDDGGLYVGFSEDGFYFERAPGPVLPTWPEDYPVLSYYGAGDISRPYWDPFSRKYACIYKIHLIPGEGYTPGPKAGTFHRRVIGVSFSDDFINWTDPYRIITPDDMDQGLFEFYAMGAIHKRGELLIGLIRTLNDDLPYESGIPDAEGIGATALAISRDGRSWHRFREPFLDRNPESGTWDRAMTWASDVLPVGDDLYVYYGGYKSGHKTDSKTGRQIGVAIMKRDRYMSLASGQWGGEMITKPFKFAGDKLVLNVDTSSGGRAWVELRDGDNNTFEGYRFEECDPIESVDSLEFTVTWNGKSNLSKLQGQPIRLALRLQRGEVFTFQFVPVE